ncbi:methyltransferase [Halobacillus andaensis]|uniref:Methyltransferase n=1 Tax=Halobacillus andaensis TaxID=1176239 RepID=A0A917EZI0_HALAA|nr:class I SAM-dependent methyltransferase [Halobacillus andaensis]MBP2006262.1 ubiquinone/menaquinone biosynthesis C-methylase UbiE [Halobacillus andaensis]GGF33781.1 methyltransferase [Halobacillus andaensis]
MSFNWHKEAEKQWNERSTFWNANSQNMWDSGSRKTIIPLVKQHVKKGHSIADLGCGDGYGSYKLAQAGYQVTGLDLSEEMIELAKSRLAHETLHFVQGDLVQLPFEGESFDAIMAINCLEWVEVPYQGLEEMKRVLKPGGKLCIGVLGPTAKPRVNSYPRVYGEEVICNTMMPWELEQLGLENGWKLNDGHGVFKREAEGMDISALPRELQQALTFMWVFIFEKE